MSPADCPWQALAEYGPPNINWCEERLCAWVNEPANAWSNLGFVAVALVIAFMARGLRSPLLRRFAPATAIVGACSFGFHASNTYVTQVLDFFGMYLFCGLLLGVNAARLGWLAPRARMVAVVGGSLALTAVTAVIVRFAAPIQVVVLGLVVAIVVTEALCQWRRPGSLRVFYAALGLLAAALACSLADATRWWCEPADHLWQGHALWHVLSALSLLAAFVHYRQFDEALR